MGDMVERRRTPRADMGTGQVIRLDQRHRVQLLDISQSGVLIACEVPLEVGTRAHLRGALGALPFSADVTVRRHQAVPGTGSQVRIGTQFATMDDRNSQNLEQFLERGNKRGT